MSMQLTAHRIAARASLPAAPRREPVQESCPQCGCGINGHVTGLECPDDKLPMMLHVTDDERASIADAILFSVDCGRQSIEATLAGICGIVIRLPVVAEPQPVLHTPGKHGGPRPGAGVRRTKNDERRTTKEGDDER